MYGHVYHKIQRPSPTFLKEFEGISTACLSDAMGRHGAMSSIIRPMYEDIHMVGSALTVLCFPGDNIMTHKALRMVRPGDVMLIDDGDYNTGCFGHNSALQARARGGVGVVVGGSVRDIRLLRRDRFPTFCRGVSPRSPQKNTCGSINVPIHIGGVVVCPGDIVVGDDDGVVVVPLNMAAEILEKANNYKSSDTKSLTGEPGTNDLMVRFDDLLRGRIVEHQELVCWRQGLGPIDSSDS